MRVDVCCEEHELQDRDKVIKSVLGIADRLGVPRMRLAKAAAGKDASIRVQTPVKSQGFKEAAMDDLLSGMVASHSKLLKNLKVELVRRLEGAAESGGD